MKAYIIKNKDNEYQTETMSFINDITQADIFSDYECACCYCPSDSVVVKITIAEGDLEEKIRKQVCNKIRNSIEDVEHSEENEAKQSSESVIYTKELFEFLDKIEKGE